MDYEEYEAPLHCEPSAVTVSDTAIKYDAQKMADVIARMAAADIVKACADDIRKSVRESVQQQITEKVGAVIEETLAAGVQKHDRFGSPVGEVTTMKSMIGKAGEEYLGQRVNERGEADCYGEKSTRLEYLVKKNVEKVIDYKMQTEIKKAVEIAVGQAQAKVAEAVAKLIA